MCPFFFPRCTLICFPYKNTKQTLQLSPSSLALSASSRVHSQFQPQLTACVSGVHEAPHFRSARSFPGVPGTSLEKLSQHTPPWRCDCGTAPRIPGWEAEGSVFAGATLELDVPRAASDLSRVSAWLVFTGFTPLAQEGNSLCVNHSEHLRQHRRKCFGWLEFSQKVTALC